MNKSLMTHMWLFLSNKYKSHPLHTPCWNWTTKREKDDNYIWSWFWLRFLARQLPGDLIAAPRSCLCQEKRMVPHYWNCWSMCSIPCRPNSPENCVFLEQQLLQSLFPQVSIISAVNVLVTLLNVPVSLIIFCNSFWQKFCHWDHFCHRVNILDLS